jgi:hypothetical protein
MVNLQTITTKSTEELVKDKGGRQLAVNQSYVGYIPILYKLFNSRDHNHHSHCNHYLSYLKKSYGNSNIRYIGSLTAEQTHYSSNRVV